MTTEVPTHLPQDVEIPAPAGWFPIELDPDRMDHSLTLLTDRQFRGRDDLPHVKAELARALREQALRAREHGALQLWLCVELAGAMPLPASLLITVVGAPAGGPGHGELGADVLEVLRSRRLERAEDAAVVDLGLGTALRTLRHELIVGVPESPQSEARATVLDFHVPIPGTDRFLLLTFSTPIPVPQLADAFVELFDAMAGAAQWVH